MSLRDKAWSGLRRARGLALLPFGMISAPTACCIFVHRLFMSAGHSFFGRHGLGAAPHGIVEVEQVECVAGHGLRGDRFYDYKASYGGQITFFAREVFEALRRELGLPHAEAAALRRNVLVSGMDLNQLIGSEFEIQGVRFEGAEECRPCYWMNSALGPGAEAWLKGRGGLRARILTDGILRREGK
jgi:MOSC domain-containing protein YiiM